MFEWVLIFFVSGAQPAQIDVKDVAACERAIPVLREASYGGGMRRWL